MEEVSVYGEIVVEGVRGGEVESDIFTSTTYFTEVNVKSDGLEVNSRLLTCFLTFSLLKFYLVD